MTLVLQDTGSGPANHLPAFVPFEQAWIVFPVYMCRRYPWFCSYCKDHIDHIVIWDISQKEKLSSARRHTFVVDIDRKIERRDSVVLLLELKDLTCLGRPRRDSDRYIWRNLVDLTCTTLKGPKRSQNISPACAQDQYCFLMRRAIGNGLDWTIGQSYEHHR